MLTVSTAPASSDGSTGTKISRTWRLTGMPEVHRDVERDHREVEDVGQHERAEHDEGEGEVVRLEVGDRLERLDPEPDHERDHRVDRQVRQQLVPGEPVAQRVDEHRDEPDQHRGRRPAQRHREHEREERAGDPLRRVLEREQVADDRRARAGRARGRAGCQSEASDDERRPRPACRRGSRPPLRAASWSVLSSNRQTERPPGPAARSARLVQRAALCRNCVFRAAASALQQLAPGALAELEARERGTTRRARGTRRRGA